MTTNLRFEIARSEVLRSSTKKAALITNVETLSSYNWIDTPASTPTIVVPGSSALWLPRAGRQRLPPDHVLIYVAQNAFRLPQSPLEPLFRAVYTTCPTFDVRSVDVITDRNNLRKLLSFIDPSASRHGLEAFTINVEIVGGTAIFCRNEIKTHEYIGRDEFRGHGHEFEKAYTRPQIVGSTGHHRIISYLFDELKFVVRHETDGYEGTEMATRGSAPSRQRGDDLADILGGLSLTPAKPRTSISSSSSSRRLVVREEGQTIDRGLTLEIKTRVLHKPISFGEIAPQLWLSQTPKLVRAYHRRGTFQSPMVEDVARQIQDWEKGHQVCLRQLAMLIRKIIALARNLKGRVIVRYKLREDKLIVERSDASPMLPKDLYAKWAHTPGKEVDSPTTTADLGPLRTTSKTEETAETKSDEGLTSPHTAIKNAQIEISEPKKASPPASTKIMVRPQVKADFVDHARPEPRV